MADEQPREAGIGPCDELIDRVSGDDVKDLGKVTERKAAERKTAAISAR